MQAKGAKPGPLKGGCSVKRYNNLFPAIYDFEGLYQSYLKARKGKRERNEVLRFTYSLEENLIQLQNELIWKCYKVSPYRQFFINEPKKRLIMALPFKDRVVQWSIYRNLNPLFDKRYITYSYACRVGYGGHKSIDKLQYWLRLLEKQHKRTYYLKLDMTKYFYRVDHNIVMSILERILKDRNLLELLETIVRCEHTPFGLSLDDNGFEGALIENVGMPIGNLSSQMIANLYLNELDQYIKHHHRVRHYMRYMDDALILHHDKKYLWHLKNDLEEFVNLRLRLKLNDKTDVGYYYQGIDWVGYRVWPTHIKLRKSTAKRMRRRLKYLQKMYQAGEATLEEVNATVQSYLGLLMHCDSYNLRQKLFDELVFIQNSA